MTQGSMATAGEGFQVSVSSLTLGTLYEAILTFSSQDRFEAFWPAVCQNARWLIPSRRMCIILGVSGERCEVAAMFEQGKPRPVESEERIVDGSQFGAQCSIRWAPSTPCMWA